MEATLEFVGRGRAVEHGLHGVNREPALTKAMSALPSNGKRKVAEGGYQVIRLSGCPSIGSMEQIRIPIGPALRLAVYSSP
jgi:hypothetical protein